MRVVVGGPPHSGKSTVTASLIKAIRERQRNRSYHLSFSWVPLDVTDNSIAGLLNPEDEDIESKRDLDWTEERADERRAMFNARDEQLVIADSPGQISDELKIVIEPADAIIILSSYENREEIEDWIDMSEKQGLDIFAQLTTVLEEDIDPGWDNRTNRKGTICSIHREDFEESGKTAYDDTTRRMIKQVATDMLKTASSQ